MASLQKTWSGDLTQSIASQLWEARQDAASLRREALSEEFIGSEVDDHKLIRGEFMGHALGARMTQMLPERFQHNMPNFRKDPGYLMRGQSRSLMSPINPKPTRAALGAKIAGQPFPNVAVGAPMSAQQPMMNNPNILSTRKDVVRVKDQKLGKFISEVAVSLSGSVNILNKRMDAIDEGVITAKEGISVTQEQLEDNGSILEDKLDAIISLLRYQKDALKDAEDQEEVDTQVQSIGQQKDVTGSDEFTPPGDENDEALMRNMQEGDVDLSDSVGQGMPLRSAESGDATSIFHRDEYSDGKLYQGPSTGYLTDARGPVTPVKNNLTEGKTAAAPTRGTNALSGTPVVTGRKIDFVDIPAVKAETEKLQQAILIPLQAAGAITLTRLGEVITQTDSDGAQTALKQLASSVSSFFGVENSITTSIASNTSVKADERKRHAETASGSNITKDENEKKKRAWWDFLGWAGTGRGGATGMRPSASSDPSSTIGVRNTRHATSIGGTRNTNNVRSTTSIGGGKNVTNKKGGIFETISNFFSLAKDRDHKVSPETTMGNTINQMQLKRYLMEHGEFPPGYQGGSGGAFGGGNLGESSYGGTENNRTTNINRLSSPESTRNRFVSLDERSKESTFSRIAKRNEPLEPIVINNTTAKSDGNTQEVEHISNVGDCGLDICYPSYV